MRRHGERGSATVLVLVLMALLGAVALGSTVVGGAVVAQRRAAAAADLATLAGAGALGLAGGSSSGGVAACEAAGKVSEGNSARLTGCSVDGLEVQVGVVVDTPAVFGLHWAVPGRARAGPSRLAATSSRPPGRLHERPARRAALRSGT